MDRTCETTARRSGMSRLHSAGAASLALVVGIAIFLPCAGCRRGGLDRNAIGGAVTLDGKPLASGGILFTPVKGTKGPVTGGAIKDGRYQLPQDSGPVAGWYRVEIHATRKTGRMVPAPFKRAGENDTVEEQEEAVAPRFNFESTLEVEVKPGENTADFSVTSR